jgi:hypothetical protein
MMPASHVDLELLGLLDDAPRELCRGGQATISVIDVPSRGESVIVKAFRVVPGVEAALREEVRALEMLHAIVGGQTIAGWTIEVPSVVAVHEQPPRLLLTRVDGESLDTLLQRGWAAPAELASVLAEVLRRYWQTTGRPLGDVNLSNLLCSPQRRRLAIVDPGLPNEFYELAGQPRVFFPASRDLGCLLHQVLTTNVLLGLTRRRALSARMTFVERLINECVTGMLDRHAVLEEIGACAAAHLSRVSGGNVVQRSWRATVRGTASRALKSSLQQMREQAA